ncbi:hypothetical protein D3C84_687440 [compost metagenome]
MLSKLCSRFNLASFANILFFFTYSSIPLDSFCASLFPRGFFPFPNPFFVKYETRRTSEIKSNCSIFNVDNSLKLFTNFLGIPPILSVTIVSSFKSDAFILAM